MKHSLDHSTATEANGIIWELCSRCEAWVSQHDRLPCDGTFPTPPLELRTAMELTITAVDAAAKRACDRTAVLHEAFERRSDALLRAYDREFEQLERRISIKAAWSFAAVTIWITACTVVLLLRGS